MVTTLAPSSNLQRALDTAAPGSRFVLRGGLYRLTAGLFVRKSGTAASPIIIDAYTGERPIFDAFSMTQRDYRGRVLTLEACAHVHVRGLELRGGPEGGIGLYDASDCVLEALDVHHNGRLSEWGGGGVVIYKGSFSNILVDVNSHHNANALGAEPEQHADGFGISAGSGNILRRCFAWRNSDDGFDTFNVGTGSKVIFDRCAAWQNGYRDDGSRSSGDGNGFKLGGHRSGLQSGGHIVEDCTAIGNAKVGLDSNGATLPLTITRSTALHNGRHDLALYGDAPVKHVVRDNTARTVYVQSTMNGTIFERNSWSAVS